MFSDHFLKLFDRKNNKYNAAGVHVDEMKANSFLQRSQPLEIEGTQIQVLVILQPKDAILAVLAIKICDLFMKDVCTGTL